MEVKNAVMPNETQLKAFNQQGEDKPIFMVNLLKFKEKIIVLQEYFIFETRLSLCPSPFRRNLKLTGKRLTI